jgi:hypothetical protein
LSVHRAVRAAPYRIGDLPESIAARITIHPQSGCWIAAGPTSRDGYARLGKEGLHRVVYRLLAGEIPPRLVLDHVAARGCISRACVWPAHHEPVTTRVNILRGRSFAAINAAKDECDHGHPYDMYTTYIRPNGHRDCRVCIRARVAKYQRKVRTGQHTPLRRAA